MKKKILIEGMTCEHCVRHIREALSEIEGVVNVEVSLKENQAIVETNLDVADQVLREAIEELEYGVIKIDSL